MSSSDRTTGTLGVAQGAALTTGAVLGTGVISMPALAAQVAGPASLLAWLALVLLSVPLALTFAALGARHPDGGGVATYVRLALGPRASAAVGWCFFFAVPLGAPPAAAFAGGYVEAAVGGGRTTVTLTSAALIAAVAVVNAFGLKVSGRVQLVLAGTLASLLTVVVVCAAPHAHASNLTPFAPHGWTAIGPAAAVLVWGFAGWEAVTSLSADYRRPRRDVPRATVVAVLLVGVLYLAVAVTSVLVLGPATGTSSAPLADLLAIGLGGPSRAVVAVVAVMLTAAAINAYFAGGARLGAALGRDDALPRRLVGADGGTRRPLAVIACGSLAATALPASGLLDLRSSMLVVTGSFTVVYVLGTAAALVLLPRRSWAWRGALVAFVAVVALLALTGRHAIGGVAVALTAVAYEARGSRRRKASATKASPAETRSVATAPTPITTPAIVGDSPQ